jgi:hypothetical protein
MNGEGSGRTTAPTPFELATPAVDELEPVHTGKRHCIGRPRAKPGYPQEGLTHDDRI